MQNLTAPVKIGNSSTPISNPCLDSPVKDWDDPFPKAPLDALVIVGVGGDNAKHELDFV